MNQNIPNEIVPIIVDGLHLNLAACQDCKTKGILAKEDDPFIQINVYQGPKIYTGYLCIPLSILLDEKNKVKENISLPCYENKLLKIVRPEILQNNLINIINNFNSMNRAYYSYEKEALLKKNIIQNTNGTITHSNGGYKLSTNNASINDSTNFISPDKNNKKNDYRITNKYRLIIGLSTFGLIGLLIWLYKK